MTTNIGGPPHTGNQSKGSWASESLQDGGAELRLVDINFKTLTSTLSTSWLIPSDCISLPLHLNKLIIFKSKCIIIWKACSSLINKLYSELLNHDANYFFSSLSRNLFFFFPKLLQILCVAYSILIIRHNHFNYSACVFFSAQLFAKINCRMGF